MKRLLIAASALALSTAASCSSETPQAEQAPESGLESGSASVNANATSFDQPEVLAPAGSYRLDLGHSSIVWRVDHLGLAMYTARFTDFEAQLEIDPSNPENAQLRVSVDPMSVHTAYPYPERTDFDLQVSTAENLLNANEFGSIDFVSTAIERTGSNTATITGDLTLLGVTLPIDIEATYNGSLEAHPFSKRPMLGFSGTTVVKRSDFGMDYLLGQIGDEVYVTLEMEFSTDAPEE